MLPASACATETLGSDTVLPLLLVGCSAPAPSPIRTARIPCRATPLRLAAGLSGCSPGGHQVPMADRPTATTSPEDILLTGPKRALNTVPTSEDQTSLSQSLRHQASRSCGGPAAPSVVRCVAGSAAPAWRRPSMTTGRRQTPRHGRVRPRAATKRRPPSSLALGHW